jgi:hypothetical protein
MDIFMLLFWGVTIVLTGLSLYKNKEKTFAAMRKSKSMMGSMLGEIIAIIFIIGLVLTLIPPESIKSALGSSNPIISTILFGTGRKRNPYPGFRSLSAGRFAGPCGSRYCSGRGLSDDADHGRGCDLSP